LNKATKDYIKDQIKIVKKNILSHEKALWNMCTNLKAELKVDQVKGIDLWIQCYVEELTQLQFWTMYKSRLTVMRSYLE